MCLNQTFLFIEVPKTTFQTPYRAYGARQMAAERLAASKEATVAATKRFEDPRELSRQTLVQLLRNRLCNV